VFDPMLTTMRERTKYIMFILAIAFVGWLVFDVGMGVTGSGQYQGGQNAGTVNRTPIRYQQWMEAERQTSEQWRQQNPGANMSREEQQRLGDGAFEKLVQDLLLQTEWERRGITVTDREIIAAVQNSPPPEVSNSPEFRTEGRFDIDKWRRFLASSAIPTAELQALEQRYRDELPRVKLLRQVTSDVYVSDAKLWQIWRDTHDSLTVRALVVRPDEAVSDASIRTTPQELEAYYRTHQSELRQPARAFMSFVGISKLPEKIDSVNTVTRARVLRDSILRGADFAEVARRESADSSTRSQGGELGTFAKGQMVPSFDRAAFSVPVGQVSEPVITTFGAHLIKVERRTADSATARHILITFDRIGARLDTLESRADSLDRIGSEQTTAGALDSVAQVMHLGINTAPPVTPDRPLLLGRFVVPDVSVWAFEARPGETSPVIENAGAFYVFRLDSVHVEGVPPLAMVEPQLRAAVVREKKRAAAEAIARDASARLARGATMDQVAQQLRLPVETIGPFTRTSTVRLLGVASAAVGSAFRLRVGERSGMLGTDEGFFVVEALRLVRADSTAWAGQKEQQRVQVLDAARRLRVRFFLEGLRAAAKVQNDLAALRRRPAVADSTAP
jgi:peptidyl-prolyl cis-trans isomerase D